MRSWQSRLFATVLSAGAAACAPLALPRPVLDRPEATQFAPPIAPTRRPAALNTEPSSVALADARHLLGRCAFGPRPAEAERVARLGPLRWLDEQLAGPPESPLLEAALVPHRRAYVPPAELVDDWLGDGWEKETQNLKELRKQTKPFYRRRRVARS